jgi:hypothetical protein
MPAGYADWTIVIATLLLPWLLKLFKWFAEGVVFAIAGRIANRALRIRRDNSVKLLNRSKVGYRRKSVNVAFTDRDEPPSPTPNSYSSVMILTKIPLRFLGI